jgi:hypothetical protein
MKRSITEIIAEFAGTQSRLCRAVISKYNLRDDGSVIFSAPKVGFIELNGEGWTFNRHGLGLRFTGNRQGHVIDAHRNFVSYPAGFDAWRLLQFLETVETANLDLSGETGSLEDESKLNELLSSLAAQGVIAPVEQIVGLYVMNCPGNPDWFGSGGDPQ